MITLRIPTPLRSYTNGQNNVKLHGGNVEEVLKDLVLQFPNLEKHLFNDADDLRPFVNLYLEGEDIRTLQGLKTPLKSGDTLMIIPSIAGGCI